jgi:hypothetical protein
MLRTALLTMIATGCLVACAAISGSPADSLSGRQLCAWPHSYGRSSGRAHYSGRTGPYGLPTGRTYYNGQYYGNFNNRFYGPQYGYF